MFLATLLAAPGSAFALSPPGLRYDIEVQLNTERHRLSGRATIVYRSGADSVLPAIHFQTYPNAFAHGDTRYAQEEARQNQDWSLRYAKPEDRGWMTIDSVSADGEPAEISIDETVAAISLPRPLAPGDSVVLAMRFIVQVPTHFDRLGRTGDAYSIAQWYPKVAVYDERGWTAEQFGYAGEFYGDFGTFDVSITLPDDQWVGATGVPVGASGGDNETPLLDADTPSDSVTVTFRAVAGDTLTGRWPAGLLWLETDLRPRTRGGGTDPRADPIRIPVPREGAAELRVPRGTPVHYAWIWGEGALGDREEADEEGRARPIHLLRAAADTAVTDTIRALAPELAPGDTLRPSLKTLQFHADRVHDFAWVCSPDYVRGDTTYADVAIRALVFRADQKKWSGLKGMTVDAMRRLSEFAGPYQWPQFTAAEAWCGGGAMEYNMLVMHEPEIYSPWIRYLDDTNAHELAHNWFQGMIASDERRHAWMDEGFAQYIEDVYTDTKYPRGMFTYAHRLPWLTARTAFTSDERAYLARAWARDEQPMSTPADSFGSYRRYDTASYSKPVAMLHTLRGMLGDSVFDAFVLRYARENAFRHPRPSDVFRAAREAAGSDLGGFFRQWTETVDRAGFALANASTEPAETGWRSTVAVRRTERMALPVTVEARFQDGTRQEAVVYVDDPIATVTFQSGARLTGATIDPRHEIVEMNRLDNHTGFFPPMRYRPIFDFPQTEEVSVLYGPTLWHGREEGIRAGAWLEGRYLQSTDFPRGILGWEAGLSRGLRDGSTAWRLGAWRRVGAFGARGSVGLRAVQDAGLFRAEASVGNWSTAPGRKKPWRTWELGARYRDRDDLSAVDSRYWSLGRTIEGSASFLFEGIGPRRAERMRVSLVQGAPAFEDGGGASAHGGYSRAGLEARQSLDVIPDGTLRLTWRIAAGNASRHAPREHLFDIAEANRLDALSRFYENDRGPLRESEHYLAEGGGGLRGFSGRAILGRRLLALNLEAEHTAVPLSVFAGVGCAEAPGEGVAPGGSAASLSGKTLADLGASIAFRRVRLIAPFWISHPEPGEQPWDIRWLVSLDLAGLHPWW
ncbi:MAG TPA: M1 family metallopeptidase [Candidatus Eisenbacteria bacterium]|nr:M1 family metallopeptidase [Candidatus Eisenbacteria bacterium]